MSLFLNKPAFASAHYPSPIKFGQSFGNGIDKLVTAAIPKQVGESSCGKTFLAEEILQTIDEGVNNN